MASQKNRRRDGDNHLPREMMRNSLPFALLDQRVFVERIYGALQFSSSDLHAARLAADKTMARAEAMRQSMLAPIDRGGGAAQPAFWAPFVVVGEGGQVQ